MSTDSTPEMADASPAPVAKRSIVIAGHRTSISLEEPFWRALKEIATAKRCSLSELLTDIDQRKPAGAGLSSTARLYVLRWYQQRAAGGPD